MHFIYTAIGIACDYILVTKTILSVLSLIDLLIIIINKHLCQEMKNQQADSKEPSQSLSLNKETKKINCSNYSPAHLICANQQCSSFSFLCANDKCQCYSKHTSCFKASKDSLVSALTNKLVYYHNIEQIIKQQIQKSIDKLSLLEQQLIAQCKQKFKELIGLNQIQKIFLASINNGNVNQIKGKDIWHMVLNHKKEKKTIEIVNQLQNDVRSIWTQFQKDVNKLNSDMKSALETFGKVPETFFTDSKVVTNTEQDKIIQGFFESQGQKIKSIKLLFRGSEGNFSVYNFHKACDNQGQTITICENTNGKKFGGYTPLSWNSFERYYTDSTYKSFVFSLNNNHKFILDSSSSDHIYCHQNYGPTFSSGHDLYISDGCNNSMHSTWNINGKYKNSNYSRNSESRKILIGATTQNGNFKVKDYQVWKVQLA